MSSLDAHFWSVLPAGGAGTRLWPLSRRARPKFLLPAGPDGRSFLRRTVDRSRLLGPAEQVLVVTGTDQADAVRRDLAEDGAPLLGAEQVVAEPSPRSSMPAIGLAAALVARRDPDAVLGSFAADHVIDDDRAFAATVRDAIAAARQDLLVTIGIPPTGPEPGFGYIEQSAPLEVAAAAGEVRSAARFVEKPDRATAEAYLATGRFLWNAGMFVARARTLLTALRQLHPELTAGLDRIADAWDTAERGPVLSAEWPALEPIAIDHALAEPLAASGRVAVVPARFGWDDIGDADALARHLTASGAARESPSGALVWTAPEADRGVDVAAAPGADGTPSTGLRVLSTTGRAVAVVGLSDVTVIDTGDALLLLGPEGAQQVGRATADLSDLGRDDLR